MRDKYTNMKKAWKDSKTIQEQNRWNCQWLAIPTSHVAGRQGPKALSVHAETNHKASVKASGVLSTQ